MNLPLSTNEGEVVAYLSTEGKDGQHNLPQVLIFEKIDRLEKISLGDTVFFAGDEEIVNVFHLLEGQFRRIMVDFPRSHDPISQPDNKMYISHTNAFQRLHH